MTHPGTHAVTYPVTHPGTKPLLLDLFCGAGGAAVGYDRAGFEVVGVDVRPQPRYPFVFRQGDAMEALRVLVSGRAWGGYRLSDFAALHASVPCQGYSVSKGLARGGYPLLIEPARALLRATGVPWVMENVAGAWRALPAAVMLCGTQFGLRVYRHRLFESSHMLFAPGMPCRHPHHLMEGYVCVYGSGARLRQVGNRGNRYARVPIAQARAAMGIGWMTQPELAQAIPPAYTEWLGHQLMPAIVACSVACSVAGTGSGDAALGVDAHAR